MEFELIKRERPDGLKNGGGFGIRIAANEGVGTLTMLENLF